jgi:hypothetical protein
VLNYLLPSLVLTVVFTLAGRLFVYRGSMFDPAVAPGIGAFAAGDLLFIGAVLVGLLSYLVGRARDDRAGRKVMFVLMGLMFLGAALLVPRP